MCYPSELNSVPSCQYDIERVDLESHEVSLFGSRVLSRQSKRMFVWTFTNDIRYVTKSRGITHFDQFSGEQVNDYGATKKERKEKPTREKFTKIFIIQFNGLD